MRPPKRMDPKDFEKVPLYDDWIKGEIEDVVLEENHIFKGKFAKTGDAIQFRFKLEGCKFQHRSGWMSYNFGEKSSLYLKFLKHLVEGAQPDMHFDLDLLKGMAIKTMWTKNGDFDNLEAIRPLDGRLKSSGVDSANEPPQEEDGPTDDTDIGF